MEKYMLIALKEAEKAFRKNEVPIGAVIVKNNKIISKAYNKKEKNNIATHHAEILAINKACKKLKNWRLNDCVLYVTVEPCKMCCGAIIQSRIKKVVYGIKNETFGDTSDLNKVCAENNIEIIDDVCSEESLKLMQLFFRKKRK